MDSLQEWSAYELLDTLVDRGSGWNVDHYNEMGRRLGLIKTAVEAAVASGSTDGLSAVLALFKGSKVESKSL